jgi:hypothetical protein
MPDWFNVDKKGLAKLLERKGLAFAVFELIQNAWDEPGVTRVEVRLWPVQGEAKAELAVSDDAPEGFKDLSHAYTLFAESKKKANPEQRGRFNVGEKLVLALCDTATIRTTTGTVIFDENGRRETRSRTTGGSIIEMKLRMTRSQIAEVSAAVGTILPPAHITTVFNGTLLERRTPLSKANEYLDTEIAGEDGILKASVRRTDIEIFEPKPGETAMLYEMGIPVVETGDKWHVNIHQKIPLNMDRDNVTPAFLRKVRAIVVNHMAEKLAAEDTAEPWVGVATASREIKRDALQKVFDTRYGQQRVMYDPSDPEANSKAVAHGYKVVHGNQLSRGEMDNVRRFRTEGLDLVKPAGQVFPTHNKTVTPIYIPESKWTPGMQRVARYTKALGILLLGRAPGVAFLDNATATTAADWNRENGSVRFNLAKLGDRFFDGNAPEDLERVHALVIHEFGHHFESDHLSHRYHDALTRLAAKLVRVIMQGEINPEDYGYTS